MRSNLGYADLMKALRKLDQALDILGYRGKVPIRATGGFAMFAHGLREGGVTADIDTITPTPDATVALAIKAVGKLLDLSEDWLNNDAVYAPYGEVTADDVEAYDAMLGSEYGSLPENFKHLDVKVASLKTLCKSKALAVRDIDTGRSVKDLKDLCDILSHMGYTTATEACRDLPWLREPEFDDVRKAVDGYMSSMAVTTERDELLGLIDRMREGEQKSLEDDMTRLADASISEPSGGTGHSEQVR